MGRRGETPPVPPYRLCNFKLDRAVETSCPELPVGVPAGQSGPRLAGVRRTADGLLSPAQTPHGTVPRSDSGPAVQCGTDGQVAEPRDGRAASRLRRTVRATSLAAGAPHRRDTDQSGGAQVAAVDVRRPPLHGLPRAVDARGHRAGRIADRPARGRGRLRPGENVWEAEAVAMVPWPIWSAPCLHHNRHGRT